MLDPLYNMKNWETFHPNPPIDDIRVVRVPGGWIYTVYRLDRGQMNSVFVPFNNEFEQPVSTKDSVGS